MTDKQPIPVFSWVGVSLVVALCGVLFGLMYAEVRASRLEYERLRAKSETFWRERREEAETARNRERLKIYQPWEWRI